MEKIAIDTQFKLEMCYDLVEAYNHKLAKLEYRIMSAFRDGELEKIDHCCKVIIDIIKKRNYQQEKLEKYEGELENEGRT